MTKSEGLKVVSEWEAERELLNRGYKKVPCPQCKGVGHFPNRVDDQESDPLLAPPPLLGPLLRSLRGPGLALAGAARP